MDNEQKTSIQSIFSKIDEINKYTALLLDEPNRVFFKKHHVPLSNNDNSELGFTKLVSFLYATLCDGENKISKKNMSFIMGYTLPKLKTLAEDGNKLRANFQHFIENSDWSDRWFMDIIQDRYPSSSNQWNKCFENLTEASISGLDELLSFLQNKHFDKEFNDIFIESWKSKPDEGCLSSTEYHSIFKEIKSGNVNPLRL